MEYKCPPPPPNKKEYITDIGRILVQDYGKKKYYTPEEVKAASDKSNQKKDKGVDWDCWAMATFTSHPDFDAYHEATGEVCDYIGMKKEMLSGLASNTSVDWQDIPDLDIDASWLDFGDIFEGVLEGIGEFIVGIFEGLT